MSNSIFYTGQSMSPPFRDGDEIHFQPCAGRPVRKGDVIIFSPPGENRFVIHRIIGAGPDGIRTRGDRNGAADPWLLRSGHILGSAVRFKRNGRSRKVPGGYNGMMLSASIRLFLLFRARVIRALDPLLEGRLYAGALAAWVPERYKARVVAVIRPEGPEWMLVMGKQVVGRRFAGNEFWQIRRRYRPFIKMQAVQKGSYTALRSGR